MKRIEEVIEPYNPSDEDIRREWEGYNARVRKIEAEIDAEFEAMEKPVFGKRLLNNAERSRRG